MGVPRRCTTDYAASFRIRLPGPEVVGSSWGSGCGRRTPPSPIPTATRPPPWAQNSNPRPYPWRDRPTPAQECGRNQGLPRHTATPERSASGVFAFRAAPPSSGSTRGRRRAARRSRPAQARASARSSRSAVSAPRKHAPAPRAGSSASVSGATRGCARPDGLRLRPRQGRPSAPAAQRQWALTPDTRYGEVRRQESHAGPRQTGRPPPPGRARRRVFSPRRSGSPSRDPG